MVKTMQTKTGAIKLWVVRIPGCDTLCSISKVNHRKGVGTIEHTWPVEISHKSERSDQTGMCWS